MTLLKTATAALFFALAACAPYYDNLPYHAEQKPTASPVSYPALAQGAVADGHVHEYH